jgi:hypothetical protein
VKEIMEAHDLDGGKTISMEEFQVMMMGKI